MTDPKKISDFAREYEYTYMANVQLNSALVAVRDELEQIKQENAELRERLNKEQIN